LQALLLVGGLGTRLRDVVKDLPKPMAPINGKPFLEYQINFLKKSGICDIILCTGYMDKKIENYFLDGHKHGISITYSNETEPLGTGGPIKKAKNMLEEEFFVLNGDSFFKIDLNSMRNFHKQNNADVTLALTSVRDNSRFGTVKLGKNYQIIEFVEKENSSGGYINGGIYLFKKSCFEWDKLPEKFSIEKELFPQLVRCKNVFGFVSDAYFVDIGTPDDYLKINSDMLKS
jgi:D-glycero-alpha-D-manno-heptose 1-phosphate guanylyltransferase